VGDGSSIRRIPTSNTANVALQQPDGTLGGTTVVGEPGRHQPHADVCVKGLNWILRRPSLDAPWLYCTPSISLYYDFNEATIVNKFKIYINTVCTIAINAKAIISAVLHVTGIIVHET